jgi:hypothetical protein
VQVLLQCPVQCTPARGLGWGLGARRAPLGRTVGRRLAPRCVRTSWPRPEVARKTKSLRFHARFSVQEHTYLLCADDTVTTSDAHDRLSTSTATSFSNTARQHPECSTGNSKTRRHELKHSTQHTDLRTPHTHTQGTHCAKREAGCARNRGLRTTRSPHGVDAVHTHCTRARKHTRTRHTSRRDTEPERGGEGEHAAAPFDGPGQKLSGGA